MVLRRIKGMSIHEPGVRSQNTGTLPHRREIVARTKPSEFRLLTPDS